MLRKALAQEPEERFADVLALEWAGTLEGEDMDLTQILWEGEGTVLTYRGRGVLRLRRLTLRKGGSA